MTFRFKTTAIVAGSLLCTIAFSTTAAAAAFGSAGFQRELHTMDMMKMIDANGDHMVSNSEFMDYYGSLFDALDTDRDGSVDAKEWIGTRGNQDISLATGGYSKQLRTIKMMDTMDTDKDHKVTKAEFIGFHSSLFKAMDQKGDGMIDGQNWLRKQTSN